jgi:hypothetical protein
VKYEEESLDGHFKGKIDILKNGGRRIDYRLEQTNNGPILI